MEKWPGRLVMGFVAIMVLAVVSKAVAQSWQGGDFLFVLLRWPLMFVVLFLVLVGVRLFFWKKNKREKSENGRTRGQT